MHAHDTWSGFLIIFSPIPSVVLFPADEWEAVVVQFHLTSFSNVEITVKLGKSEIGLIVVL